MITGRLESGVPLQQSYIAREPILALFHDDPAGAEFALEIALVN
jgi:hypothetical protein